MTLLSSVKCKCRFFEILWPSQNIRTLKDFLKKLRYSLASLTAWPEFKTDLMGPPYCKIVFYVIGYSWKKTFSKGFITDYACSQKKMVKNVAFKEGARDREYAKVAHTLWLLVWKSIARCAPIFKPSKPLALWNYYSGLKRKKGQRVSADVKKCIDPG